jgi:hypothetical protein
MGLRKRGKPSNSVWKPYSYISSEEALIFDHLGYSPWPFLVISEHIWTCLGCTFYVNIWYVWLQEICSLGASWALSWA